MVRALIRRSWVRIPLGAYAHRQGILYSCLSRSRCSGYVPGRNLLIQMSLSACIGSSAKAGTMIDMSVMLECAVEYT